MLEYDISCQVKLDQERFNSHIKKASSYLLKLFGTFEGVKPARIEIFSKNNFPRADVLGTYSPENRKIDLVYVEDEDELLYSLVHEMNHQLLFDRLTKPPRWLLEGFAEYHKVINGKIFPGEIKFAELHAIKESIKCNRMIDLELLLNDDKPFCRDKSLAYAESWAFVHFLIKTERFGYYVGKFALTKKCLEKEEIKDVEDCWMLYLNALSNRSVEDSKFWRRY